MLRTSALQEVSQLHHQFLSWNVAAHVVQRLLLHRIHANDPATNIPNLLYISNCANFNFVFEQASGLFIAAIFAAAWPSGGSSL